jgi:hypothetical protein
LRDAWFVARRARVGLGRATLAGWEELGEAVALGGRIWVRGTQRGASDYYRVAGGERFRSNHFVYVPRSREAREYLRVTGGQTQSALEQALADRHPGGVLAAGYARFERLQMIAIAAPPVGGVPVRANAARYYTRPMESSADAWAYVVIAAAKAGDDARSHTSIASAATADTNAVAGRWLAKPPGRRVRVLAYALRLQGPPTLLTLEPVAQDIVALGEVTAASVLAEGELALYPVTRLAECETELKSRVPSPES